MIPLKRGIQKKWSILLLVLLGLLISVHPGYAQEAAAVQEVTGYTEPGTTVFYRLPNLKQGQKITLYAAGTSGNLDPFVAITDQPLDRFTLRDSFWAEIEQGLAMGRDPLEVVPEIADQLFLAWDDDSGEGYDAALEYRIPADGDFQLVVGTTPAPATFGDYRLLIGLGTPEVLTGQARPTGDTIAVLDEKATRPNFGIEELTGSLTPERPSTFFLLKDVSAGDTLYAYAEGTSGDLAPILVLRDFGTKPLRTGNFSGQETTATIEYRFENDGSNYSLRLQACCEGGSETSGDYRLLVGINAPEVLTGQATARQSVVKKPIEVKVGTKMEQISDVDQKAENFGTVVDMQMDWTDPALAFSPAECQCAFQTFTTGGFEKYLAGKGVTYWPAFTLFNQQGRRDSQNQIIVVRPNGETTYVERFSATLQAPDFDFTLFPFDRQQFHIRLRSVFPEEFFIYKDLENFSRLGTQLGEEEWIVTSTETSIDTFDGSSRFSFSFEARRHLTFYVFRIFVPLAVIIIVSWFTFFLKDYGKRVDVASANLLLFIAFNFTISSDLPRLGYLTLMDRLLVSTFVVTGLVIVFNVYLKRLEVGGKESFAHRVDQYMIWIYPLAYILAFGVVTIFFTG